MLGKTGMGKSTVLENMIIQDIINGKGVGVVDPHGDLVEKVVQYIPSRRINDVIYFNPYDLEYPIAFNVLEKVDPLRRHLVASGIVGVFKKIWAESWGPRLEYLLRNTILALLDYPDSTLLGVTRMLADKEYRKKVVARIQDPIVKAFWLDEFSKYTDKFATEAIAPIQNKVGQFLSVPLIRNIIGQVQSSFDMREVMDNQKILLMNLSKGRIGEDNSAMLGAMLITKISLAAMSRVDIPEDKRNDFYVYVDEFQNFATESFADILSEARKYHLCLIIAHQYIAQLNEEVRDAVFGNVGSLLCFRVGAADAEFLEKEFEPTFMLTDLVNLPKWSFYMKLMIDGVASSPFSAGGLPPMPSEFKTDSIEKIIKISRERYAKPRSLIEDKIRRWSEGDEGSKEEGEEESEQKKEKFNVKCSNCQKDTYVFFKPDGVRPVYCKECLQLLKQGVITSKPPAVRTPARESFPAARRDEVSSGGGSAPRRMPEPARPAESSLGEVGRRRQAPAGRRVFGQRDRRPPLRQDRMEERRPASPISLKDATTHVVPFKPPPKNE